MRGGLNLNFVISAYQLLDSKGTYSWSAKSTSEAQNLHSETRTVVISGRIGQTGLLWSEFAVLSRVVHVQEIALTPIA